MQVMTPRDYQLRTVDHLRLRVQNGKRSVCVVAPCGSGKTIIAAMMVLSAAGKGTRCLFLAHRRELVRQTYDKIVQAGIEPQAIGVIMAGTSTNVHAGVQLASVDTLRNREYPPAELVISDECHHDTSPTRREIAAHYASAVRIGLTATPTGASGGNLGDLYEEMYVVAQSSEMIAAGHVLEPRVWTVPVQRLPDMRGVHIAPTGDYIQQELLAAVDRAALTGDAVEHYQRLAPGLPAVVFPVSIEHSKHVVEQFCAAGIRALHLDCHATHIERARILGEMRTGNARVLSSCDCVSEGFDFPELSCAIDLAPTTSLIRHMQRMGRVLRPAPGKSRPIILDHAGNCLNHGLPHSDREWSLDTPAKRENVNKPPPSVVCPQCFGVFPAGTLACPLCGCSLRAVGRSMPEACEGELVEAPVTPPDERHRVWTALVTECLAKNYKPGWAKIKFRDRFGRWPDRTFAFPEQPPRVYTDSERREVWRRLVCVERSESKKRYWARIEYARKFHSPVPGDWLDR